MVSNKQSRPHFEQLKLMAPSDGCIIKSEESRWIHVVIAIQYFVDFNQITPLASTIERVQILNF